MHERIGRVTLDCAFELPAMVASASARSSLGKVKTQRAQAADTEKLATTQAMLASRLFMINSHPPVLFLTHAKRVCATTIIERQLFNVPGG